MGQPVGVVDESICVARYAPGHAPLSAWLLLLSTLAVMAGVVYAADTAVGSPCVSSALLAIILLVASLHIGPPRGDSRTEVERLRAMDLRGKPRLCRDVAVRFLEGAERHGRRGGGGGPRDVRG